jgi:hypothetical protein
MKGDKDMIATNPYLPLYEYVPDGEPRIFQDRLYVYGSHDVSGGDWFCLDDYVVWSAPLDDLGNWRYEGISYRKNQDPHNRDGKWELFAPDVVQGNDGKYYLFYCLRMQREFGVAVGNSPAGPFEFYGHIHHPDGTILSENMPYDPSVLVDDDGRVFLYYGFTGEEIAKRLGADVSPGCMVMELESDMLTVKQKPQICLPRNKDYTGAEYGGHCYYEGPSMRKINGRYYLVYSSEVCHELCYAVSDSPMDGFRYGGVIVSNGDIGLNGRQYPVCLPGNNHGGLVCVGGQYFIFYQRHTQCTQYSRQGCAEPITILEDGSIPQVEITSSGLNCAPLPAKGSWSAAYACHLTHADGEKVLRYREADTAVLPYITEENTTENRKAREHFIRNITDGTTIGFKYFAAEQVEKLTLALRGNGNGSFVVRLDDPSEGPVLGSVPVESSSSWQDTAMDVKWNGTNALYFIYEGTGSLDLKEITFSACL